MPEPVLAIEELTEVWTVEAKTLDALTQVDCSPHFEARGQWPAKLAAFANGVHGQPSGGDGAEHGG